MDIGGYQKQMVMGRNNRIIGVRECTMRVGECVLGSIIGL